MQSQYCRHITKVFFELSLLKMWKFSKIGGGTNCTHYLYSYVAVHLICTYPILSSVGHCIVYSDLGHSTTFNR